MIVINCNSTLHTLEGETSGFETMYLVRIIEIAVIHMIYITSVDMRVLSFLLTCLFQWLFQSIQVWPLISSVIIFHRRWVSLDE
jgi:hypothetical protein